MFSRTSLDVNIGNQYKERHYGKKKTLKCLCIRGDSVITVFSKRSLLRYQSQCTIFR